MVQKLTIWNINIINPIGYVTNRQTNILYLLIPAHISADITYIINERQL